MNATPITVPEFIDTLSLRLTREQDDTLADVLSILQDYHTRRKTRGKRRLDADERALYNDALTDLAGLMLATVGQRKDA